MTYAYWALIGECSKFEEQKKKSGLANQEFLGASRFTGLNLNKIESWGKRLPRFYNKLLLSGFH
jgi:hypothetical protein